MASENGDNTAPDSWEDGLDSKDQNVVDGNDLSKPLSGLSFGLNANAPAFVPGGGFGFSAPSNPPENGNITSKQTSYRIKII